MISVLDDDFSSLNEFVSKSNYSKIFILCDENTHEYCLPTLLGNLEINIPFEIIEIEPGEELKTLETAVQLWEILAEMLADKKSLLINLGGGVITDMGGFVGSTYKRGIDFVHIPTSLLGICDASIGGKTGIDHGFLKNLVGTFALPKTTFLYIPFLKSLPYVELRSGFAEMLKHGLVADKCHWEQLATLEKIAVDQISPLIENSMKIKQSIVNQDFDEKGLRKILNFGHTVGHAVEGLFLQNNHPIPHGEAVAVGMIVETKLSCLEGILPITTGDEIIDKIKLFFPIVSIDNFSNDSLISMMLNDKKNENSEINFSLLNDIGHGIFDIKCQKENINKAIDFYKNLK